MDALALLIKYSAIIGCNFFIYVKLLHIKITKKTCASFMIFSLFCLPSIYFLRIYAAPFSIFAIVIFFVVWVIYTIKTPLNLSLTVSIISFGLSYLAFWLATVPTYLIGFLYSLYFNKYPSDVFSFLLIGTFQILFTAALFQFRRLKNGMPFLYEYGSNDIAIFISISLLFSVSFLGSADISELIYLIPVFFSFLLGLALLLWWINSLNKKYIVMLKMREIESLQKELESYKYHNDELSKIIHKDNKLIPAMEYAVREYLSSAEKQENQLHLKRANELLDQLKCMSQERNGILKNYEIKNKILPITNISSLDSLLVYMFHKANQHDISFDLSLAGSINYFVENIINETDIKIVLADMIDNAILATQDCQKRKIFVMIGKSNGHYSIDVFDSGTPFNTETLNNIGLKRITTRANKGGSGIGLMTLFEISQKYRASLVIENPLDGDYKKVSLCFDKLGQYRIKLDCQSDLELISKRTDIILYQ
ncbi:MAG: GHKL domain-containing protein [Lachnospiraceae bacterium]|nr:GHKL domain-containing protein [Lachnospiraceae bacterium]